MRKKSGLFSATLILLCLSGWTVSAQRQSLSRTAWEYMTTGTYDPKYKGDVTLNELGAQGWELVSVTSGCNNGSCWTACYLKRAK